MRVTIVGTGYVGLVTGVCLADSGHHVIGLDIDARVVDKLNRGESPIFEPGLSELLVRNLRARHFRATTDLAEALREAEVVFIAVGTPQKADGEADTSMIENSAADIARAIDHDVILVVKSTVPVGTGEKVEGIVKKISKHRITVVSNPEFLKEGTAVEDFVRPDRVVIGSDDPAATHVMCELYAPLVLKERPIVKVSRRAAEMIKYAANCYLAMRISYINQVANVCQKLGIDVNDVRTGIGSDKRIGSHFMFPGIGYGGSCFPKDVRAFCAMAEKANAECDLVRKVDEVNERQKRALLAMIQSHFKSSIAGRTFAVWGIAFKANTDDIRESPALSVIRGLLENGAAVRANDPEAGPKARAEFGSKIEVFGDAYEAASGADALVICTEWRAYRSPDFSELKKCLRSPLIFDGRNLMDLEDIRREGFVYYSIGRPPVL